MSAPTDWSQERNYQILVDIIYEEKPDIIALQEIPSERLLFRLAKNIDMVPLQPVMSHSGLTSMLLPLEIEFEDVFALGPAICAKINIMGHPLSVTAAHLPFGKDAGPKRFAMFERYLPEIEMSSMLFMGDLNLRENETKAFLEKGMKDAYFEIGKPGDQRYSWDGKINKFREMFVFHARFDRIFYKGLKVKSYKLVGNTPASDNPNHFISDHFGVAAEFDFPIDK